MERDPALSYSLSTSYALSTLKYTETNEDLGKLIFELRDRYGVAHLAYYGLRLGMEKDKDLLFATGSRDFCDHYVDRSYVDIDPVMREVRRRGTAVDWDTVDHASAAAKRYFDELKRYEVGRRGMTIPCFTPEGEIGVLSFSANHSRDVDWAAFRDQVAPHFSFIGLHFHAVAMRIARGLPFEQKVKLTPQGRRLLSLFAQGHPPAMIAHMTGLSIHTVRMHLTNLQARLGCATKAGLIKKALDLGLVSKNAGLLIAPFLVEFSNADQLFQNITSILG